MATDFTHLGAQLERVYSQRLALRPLSFCDAWPLYRATRNPLFNTHLLWDQPRDETELYERVDAILSAARRARLCAVSAVVKDTGEWMSLFRFQPHALDASLVEMGIWTSDKFWGSGFSLELTRACMDAAFSLGGVTALMAAAAPDNAASCEILRRCGLQPAGLVRRSVQSAHAERSIHGVALQEFVLTREQWLRADKAVAFSHVPAFPGEPMRGVEHTAPASGLHSAPEQLAA